MGRSIYFTLLGGRDEARTYSILMLYHLIAPKMKKSKIYLWLWIGLSLCIAGVMLCVDIKENQSTQPDLHLRIPTWQDSVEWKKTYSSGKFRVREYDTSNLGEGSNEATGVVLHHTACKSIKDAFNILTTGETGVSCHVLIDEDGSRYVLATPDKVTHHAGFSRLNGRESANQFTIGIEFQGNTLNSPLTEEQIESAIEYLRPIIKKYDIPLKNIVTHEFVRNEWKKANPKKKGVPGKVDVTYGEYQKFMTALKDSLSQRATPVQ